MKMYILIKDWVDVGHAINSAAHAGMIAYKEWQHEPEMVEYFKGPIKKVTCKVDDKLFEDAKHSGHDYIIITEKAFNDKEVALIFKPSHVWHKGFTYLPLWR